MKRSLMRYGLAAAATIAIFATVVGVSFGATGSNICATTGVTRAVAIKIFGSAAQAVYSSEFKGTGYVSPAECAISVPAEISTNIQLFPKSQFETQVKNATYSDSEYGHASTVAVSGAGNDAMLMLSSDYYAFEPVLLFEAGAYAVLIEPNESESGRPQSVYKQWEALARAIHAHLG
jgi:hypothetical protein